MTDVEPRPPAGAGSELQARIQARVAERRQSVTGSHSGHLTHRTTPTPRTTPTHRATPTHQPAPVTAVATTAAVPRTTTAPTGSAGAAGTTVTSPADTSPAGTSPTGTSPTGTSPAGLETSPSGSGRFAGGRRRHAPSRPPVEKSNRLVQLVLLVVLTAVAVFGLRVFVVASYYIPSASMETTLHGCPGCQPDLVLVDKLSYRFTSVHRNDVIVFNRPPLAPPEDKQLIKRVIALPGETVSGHGGQVFVDGRQLTESFVNPACSGTADFAAVKVPAGRYFVMGDNRCNSFDSRIFGTIPRSSVVGRAFAVMWPVHHLRWL